MPDLTLHQLTLALMIVAALAVLAFLIVLILAARLRKVRRSYALLRGEGEEKDIFAAFSRVIKRVQSIEQRVDHVTATQQEESLLRKGAMQRFGLVRYDAFDDMGGRLSFSAALLDDNGDGVIISSINGRTETRTYAKLVRGLTSENNLSDEEREAIAIAVEGSDRSEPAATATK
ncbi:MAG: hypothetical protein QOG21_1074 [Actinomycetota bacterium]|nr:hypothetical protein [Actinomycetota bacterium]